MGTAVSECCGVRKKQLFIDPIRIERENEERIQKRAPAASLKASKTTTKSKHPKTPMELLFPTLNVANDTTARSENSHVTLTEHEPSKKRDELSDITSSLGNSHNIQMIVAESQPLIKDKSQPSLNGPSSLNRPPQLKHISKIDGACWSPIKE